MKKIILTLALGFIVSMQSFASNNILNTSNKINIFEDCYNLEIYSSYGECPDGSTYFQGAAYLFGIGDCETGYVDEFLDFGSIEGYTEEEACGD